MCSGNGENEMNRDKELQKITDIAHKMKSGEIPVAVTYDSLEAFIKALRSKI